MRTTLRRVLLLSCLLALAAAVGYAQAPTGSIAGTITDQSSAVIPNASITVTNMDTGLTRTLSSGAAGNYHVASLPAGNYRVKVEMAGFKSRERAATVVVGSTTTVDFQMEVGAPTEVVTVEEAAPLVSTESYKIDGVVTRQQIQNLPLNGRNFLQLAFLEPGVMVTQATLAQYNAQFEVRVLGGAASQTRITVDGTNTVNPIEGGSQQNFSQEMIQEFQVSSANFDLSTGITGVGAINIVTRSGSNDFHGAGYFYFRDHNMAGFPGVGRPSPSDPLFAQKSDPFFARRQAGFYFGGPLKKDRLFFFTNLENLNQDSVVEAQPTAPEFARFGGIFPNPYKGRQVSARFDFRVSDKHSGFLRYSHDGNHGLGPRVTSTIFNPLPSGLIKNTNWADQSVGSLTSSFRPTLVNELRFAYTYWHNRNFFPAPSDCPGCLGLGLPQIEIGGQGSNSILTMGNTTNAPQGRDLRHYITSDNVTIQHGAHRFRFGGEWDHAYGTGFWGFLDPAAMVLFSPAQVRAFNSAVPPAFQIPIPSSFNTLQDILSLPLIGFSVGVGDPSQPPPFQIDRAKPNNRFHLYWQDTWKARPRFTLNYGLGWTYETNLLNHDLTKPDYLIPLFGADGVGPEHHRPLHFSPALGFAWSVTKDNKTVLRAGAGVYFGTFQLYRRLTERTFVGPVGNGRLSIGGSSIPNPYGGPGLPAIPGVAPGVPLSFPLPTRFTGGNLVALFPVLLPNLTQLFSKPGNTDLSVRTVEVAKSAAFADALLTRDFTPPYAEHYSIGIQRELTRDWVVSADFVFRQAIHVLLDNADYNRWVDVPTLAGFTVHDPVMPRCVSGAQAANPKAVCSTGVFRTDSSGAREHYKGLLVKVDKRFSKHIQFLASYALSSNVGWNGSGVTDGFNNENWFENFGPLDSDRRHVLNMSGVVDLPWDPTNLLCSKEHCAPFQISFISSMASKAPFSAFVAADDFNGDGTSNDPLPGTEKNQFNRSLGNGDLTRLVNQFNQTLAGKRTSRGQATPTIVLPSSFNFGDTLFSQDLRLSKTISFRERYKITLLGEVFNLFNIANLGGFGTNLVETATFGQPTNRSQNAFGSGGPRAFQIAARFMF